MLHDTTEFVLKGEQKRDALARKRKGSCLHGHFALAVAEGEAPRVHGVVGQRAYVVEDGGWREFLGGDETEELLSGAERWEELAAAVREEAEPDLMLIHMMVSREVPLSRRGTRRPPRSRKAHPDRDARLARLSVRAGFVTLARPEGVAPVGDPTLTLSVVEVVELDAPEGETPVHWRLLSSLPVHEGDEVVRIVDIYRKRWLIEEFFKSLEMGCAAEKRQGRSLASLWNTLTLLVPVA